MRIRVNKTSSVKGLRRMALRSIARWNRGVSFLNIMIVAVVIGGFVGSAVAVKPPLQPRARKRLSERRRTPNVIGAKAKPSNKAKTASNVPLDPNAPRPHLTVDNKTHDFGTVWIGPALPHTFKITNEGNAPLEIKRVKPSCGCTVAGAYPKTIAPGETGEFPFSVKSTRLRGRFVKSIAINTNDPDNGSIRLQLKGEVKQYVEIVPPNVYFGKLRADEPSERVLKISNNTEKPLEIKVAEKMKGNFDVEIVTKEPGQRFELHVTAKPPYKEGVFREFLKLTTNIEAQKNLKLDVRGTVPQRLEVNPKALSIGRRASRSDPDKPITRIVRVSNYGRTPVKVLSATVDDPGIKTKVIEQVLGKSYSVEVKMPVGYKLPAAGRKLVIRTDDKGRPQFTVPITEYKRPTANVRPAEKLVGRPAPGFNVTTADGKTFDSRSLKGNVTVIDFFAPNCGFCKKQIPRLDEVREKYTAKGVRFVAISQTMRNKKYTDDQIKQLIGQLGFGGDLVLDQGNTIGPRFKATSYPSMFVIDKAGKIAAVNLGNIADLEKRLAGQLDTLLGGKSIAKDTKVAKAPAKPKPKPAPRKRADDLIGKPAPRFSIQSLDGKRISNSDFAQSKATILNFVATNCGYCGKQIPRLEAMRKKYESKGVRFVNVVETMRKKYSVSDVKDKMKSLGSHLECAHDVDNKVGPLFNARGFPTMIVVGQTGNIEAVNVGNIADLEKRLSTQLDAVIAGKPVPKVAAAAPKPQRRRSNDLVGKPAPKFTMSTMDGKTVSSDDFGKYRATILNFVATNCGYCGKQIPRLEAMRKKYEGKGVRFVNMVQTMRKKYSKEDVLKKMKTLGSNLELVHDVDNKVGPSYGATGFPTMVVVGKTGNIEAVNVGNIGDLEKRLVTQLDAVIAGKPVPRVAAAPRPQRKRPNDLVGKTAPKFTMRTMGGKTVSSDDFGKNVATVLNFVATNCGYCGKQIPRLEAIRKKYESKGIRFVNMVQTMRKKFSKEDVLKKMNTLGSNLELVHDVDNKVGPSYGATGFPTMVVVGKTGRIEAVNVGNIADLEKRVIGQLDAIIAGKPLPKVATTQRPRRRPAEDLVGKQAPTFTVTTLDGKKISNSTFKNHPATVLNFVAPNCGFCKRQVPTVEKIRKEYQAKGIRFVNVVQKMRKDYTEDQIVDIFKGVGSHLEISTSDFSGNAVGRLFKAVSFPTMIVVNKSGKIAHVNIGAKQNLDSLLKGQLDALIKG